MMSSSSASDTRNAAPLQRPGGGMKWSEVCERVQQPDGSVRTSPRIKGGIASTVSPPRPRPASHGMGKLGRLSGSGGSLPTTSSSGGAPSSRGGSSRDGSSGKSSRSSSLDGSHKARDGDISSRCSSGCWDTCTNSSGQSRSLTPLMPSPSGANSLYMPDPIRTGLILPPSLLDDETVHVTETIPETENASENKLEEHSVDEVVHDPVQPCFESQVVQPCFESQGNQVMAEPRPGAISFKWDPYGRDVPRRNCDVKSEWSVEPLAKYLKRVVEQINANIETNRLPTADKLDAFVLRLVGNTHRLLKHAPKKMRQTLHGMLTRRFQRFWNYSRNEKVRSTDPQELKSMLTWLIDALVSEFGVCPDAVEECFLRAPEVRQAGGASLSTGSWLFGQYAMSPDRQDAQSGRHLVQHQHHRLALDPRART